MNDDQRTTTVRMFSRRSIVLSVGDICTAPTAVIVNAANTHLGMRVGLGRHIALLGGQEIQAECEQVVASQGKLDVTDVVTTTAGRLPYEAILHAVGPSGETEATRTLLERTIERSLRLADRREWASIAFPAIATGGKGATPQVCAQAFVSAMKNYWTIWPNSKIREVHICLMPKLYPIFAAAIVQYRASTSDQDEIKTVQRTPGTGRALPIGAQIGSFQVVRILGQGGFGITYLAENLIGGEDVAIKEFIPVEIAHRAEDATVVIETKENREQFAWGLERFVDEARTLTLFAHPSIVKIENILAQNNTAYIVMPYERGETLHAMVHPRKTLPEDRLVAIVEPLLDGLECVHGQGLIHRDIKPANVHIRADGLPVLLDFGSARRAVGERTHTLTSLVSPRYAAFEQYHTRSSEQGPWTDIYGIAATLYRCIAGFPPRDALDRSNELIQQGKETFVFPSEIGHGRYSDRFLEGVDRGLAFQHSQRPQSIEEWRGVFRSGGAPFSAVH